MKAIGYASPDKTYVPNLAVDPSLVIGYPGWVVGVVPDCAEGADALERTGELPVVFTVDGEEFRESPGGLVVIKGPDAVERILAARDKINALDAYKDSIIFVFGVTFRSNGEATDGPALFQDARVYYPGSPEDMGEIRRIESRKPIRYVEYKPGQTPPRRQSLRGDASAVGASHVVDLARCVEYVRPGGAMSSGLTMDRRIVERSIRNHSRLVTFPPVLLAARLEPVRPQTGPRRNEACPCGSGRKFKACCMRKR